MEVVKGLVSSGITIAATIHSPTPRTFALFDRVLILQRGHIVYFGDNGDAAKQYFAQSPHFQVLYSIMSSLGTMAMLQNAAQSPHCTLYLSVPACLPACLPASSGCTRLMFDATLALLVRQARE